MNNGFLLWKFPNSSFVIMTGEGAQSGERERKKKSQTGFFYLYFFFFKDEILFDDSHQLETLWASVYSRFSLWIRKYLNPIFKTLFDVSSRVLPASFSSNPRLRTEAPKFIVPTPSYEPRKQCIFPPTSSRNNSPNPPQLRSSSNSGFISLSLCCYNEEQQFCHLEVSALILALIQCQRRYYGREGIIKASCPLPTVLYVCDLRKKWKVG